MPQLLNHGKKTVPAALRRDVWRPYFSIHFPPTSVGARAGIIAYQRLREFAVRRQLSPEEGSLMTTLADIEKVKRKAGEPTDVRQKLRDGKLRLPTLGHKLPQRYRAEKLMDQKATSVADVSFVLGMATEWMEGEKEGDDGDDVEKERERMRSLGRRGQKRLKAIRQVEAVGKDKIEKRQEFARTVDWHEGKVKLDGYAAQQLSYGYDAALGPSNRLVESTDLDTVKTGGSAQGPVGVNVLWADMRDGTYAQSWPGNVFHAELTPYATAQRMLKVVTTHAYTDDDGEKVSEQWADKKVVTAWSPHVMGRELVEGALPFQEAMQREMQQVKPLRMKQLERQKEWDTWDEYLGLRASLNRADETTPLESVKDRMRDVESHNPDWQEMAERKDEFDMAVKENSMMFEPAKAYFELRQEIGIRQTEIEALKREIWPGGVPRDVEGEMELVRAAKETVVGDGEQSSKETDVEGREKAESMEELAGLEKVQKDEQGRLGKVMSEARMEFVSRGLSKIGGGRSGGYGLSWDEETDEPDTDYLRRTQGIEVEGRKKGVWDRVKWLFGRR